MLGGLLGGGPSRTDQLMEENSRRLAELSDNLSGFSSTLGNQAEAGRAALKLASDPGLREGFQPGKLDPDRAQAALDRLGFSMEELQAVAKRLGIDIDDGGKLVGDALVALAKAVGVTIDRMTTFETSLSDREQVLATRDALGLGPNAGLPSDVQALARTREIQLTGLELDPLLEAQVAALDLSTEEGRQAFPRGSQHGRLRADRPLGPDLAGVAYPAPPSRSSTPRSTSPP